MKRIVGVIWLLLLMAVPAFATVSVETTRVAYTCNGVLTSYAYPFKVLADADLLVVKKATATSAETTLTLNTDYTVTGAGTSGGNVVLTAGSKCASGYTLTILRDMAATQTTDYVDGEAFSAVSIEDALDKVTMIQQQQREQIGRTPKLPKTSTITDISLPNPTANNYIGWNAGATGLENKSSPVITTATQYEVDALVSYGGGTSFTQATIEAALTAIGTTNKATLLLRPGTWVISNDLTITSNITLIMPAGSIAQVATTKTLTINGPFEAGLYQVFDCAGSGGSVIFNNSQTTGINSTWFTGLPDGIMSNNSDMQLAITATPSGGLLYTPQASNAYILENLTIVKPIKWKGDGFGSVLKAKSTASGYMITINGSAAGAEVNEEGMIDGVIIADLRLEGNMRTPDIGALFLSKLDHSTFERLWIKNFQREAINFYHSVRESTFSNIHTRWNGNRLGNWSGYPNVNLRDMVEDGSDAHNGIYFNNFYSTLPMGDHFWLDTKVDQTSAVRQVYFSDCFIHGITSAYDGNGHNPFDVTFTAAQKAFSAFVVGSATAVTISNCSMIAPGGILSPGVNILTGSQGNPSDISINNTLMSGRYSFSGAPAIGDILIHLQNGELNLDGSILKGSGTAGAENIKTEIGTTLRLGRNHFEGYGPTIEGIQTLFGDTAIGYPIYLKDVIVPVGSESVFTGDETFTSTSGNIFLRVADADGHFNPSGTFPLYHWILLLNYGTTAKTITFDDGALNVAVADGKMGLFVKVSGGWKGGIIN